MPEAQWVLPGCEDAVYRAVSCVYAMIDSRPRASGLCRYIGQTGDLSERKARHARMDGSNHARDRWLRAMAKEDYQPIYQVLWRGPKGQQMDREEQRWIASYQSIGQADLNLVRHNIDWHEVPVSEMNAFYC